MGKGRLEAFSDGVIAILLTIMVLELQVPRGADLAALRPMIPTLMSYVLSFIYIGIYWSNHHHLLQASSKVSGGILWANLHLLFWLSLVPWVTNWMGETHFSTVPVALYGILLFMAGMAYYILARLLIAHDGANSTLAAAIGKDKKGIASVVIYATAVALAFIDPRVSCALYVSVAIMWIIPDRRIERKIRT